MKRMIPNVILSIVIWLCAPGLVNGQATQRIGLTKLVELSSEDEPVVPSFFVTTAQLSSGEFVVSYEFSAGAQIVQFGANGRYLKTHEDRPGKGPGDFTS